ncbi:MAG TPA: integrase arm-type DNA-binding domain-containing protein [Xanthobacteraceae bacterium]|nr:integrase arm-type DNA-binding domain-containing protein [Xanthobacteraceae bacterium]
MGLTVKKIERLKQPGRYADGHGLYLQVMSATNRSWLLRYERNGRERWLGLGPLHTFDLSEARERARKARQLLQDGIDPIEQRKSARAAQALAEARALTFQDAARQYFDAHERSWKNAKHRAQFLSTLETYAFPKIGRLSVAEIDTGLVLKVLEPIWHQKTETANRVRARIESVLDWATVRGYRTGDNPARWKGHLSETLPSRERIQKVVHHAALPYDDVSAFFKELKEREGVSARALEFTILTAARTGETIGATWEEIDLEAKTWTVPAGRIKGGREHKVPLSDRALEVLRGLPREKNNPSVFVGPRRGGLSNMSMASVLKRMGRDDITVHGFRSTFRDWAAECTNYPNHVVEMALAHAVGDKVEAAYRRGDLFEKRRRLMTEWAKFCGAKPTNKAAADIIVSLRSRKRAARDTPAAS